MPPQIINYNPNAGLEGIQKAGQQISTLLGEAKQAELALGEKKRRMDAIQYLNDVIRTRTAESDNKLIGSFPMFDPAIREAALSVSQVAPDYVELLAGMHEKNVKSSQPTAVAGGYVELDPTTGANKFVETADKSTEAPSTIESIFGKGTSTNDILTISHLGDKDIFQLGADKQPILDDKGQPKIDQVALAKKVTKDMVDISVLKTGGGAAVTTDVKGEANIKEEIRLARKGFDEAQTKFLVRYKPEDIALVISGQHIVPTKSGKSTMTAQRFTEFSGNGFKDVAELTELVNAWKQLPKEDQEVMKKRYGVTDKPAAPAAPGAPASTEKPNWND
jgi:hypothetical protein